MYYSLLQLRMGLHLVLYLQAQLHLVADKIVLHNFFLSLLLLIKCILSLHRFFRLKIFGRHQESNPGPLV